MNFGYGGPMRQGYPDHTDYADYDYGSNGSSPSNNSSSLFESILSIFWLVFTISIFLAIIGINIWWILYTKYTLNWIIIIDFVGIGSIMIALANMSFNERREDIFLLLILSMICSEIFFLIGKNLGK